MCNFDLGNNHGAGSAVYFSSLRCISYIRKSLGLLSCHFFQRRVDFRKVFESYPSYFSVPFHAFWVLFQNCTLSLCAIVKLNQLFLK